MKVGLVRHFKVLHDHPKKKIISQNDFFDWANGYNSAEIKVGEVDVGAVEWKKCFTSNMSRATKTATSIFSGNIIMMDDLREVPMYPLFKKNVILPFLLWPILVRSSWLINHKSQLESKADVELRITKALDIIFQEDEDVLIVGHGALMILMKKELLKRGFLGPKLNHPKNGILYVFENNKV